MDRYAIEWVGSGSGLNLALGNTAFLVYGAKDRVLLVDCGATVPSALLGSGKMSQITDILITHAHGDHFHGLEALGFYFYYALSQRGDQRPNLYFPGRHVAASVRTALEVSMGLTLDEAGNDRQMSLMDYFKVITGDHVDIPGLPAIDCHRRKHVSSLESFGLELEGGVFYSGDTIELPPLEPRLLFQDCQFFGGGPGDVHISFERLSKELPQDVKARTYLVHVGGGWDRTDVVGAGFAGVVRPGQRFEIGPRDKEQGNA